MTPPDRRPTGPRDPDEVLAELGGRLDRAFAAAEAAGPVRRAARRLRPIARTPRSRRRWVAAGVAGALLVGPTAVATRDTLFTTAPPAAPGLVGGPGATPPESTGTPVLVAQGTAGGVDWTLSASLCRYGAVQAVGLFLDVPGGGAGARCDVAGRRAAPAPSGLRDRRVLTYVDPVAGRTWVFGVLPARGAAAVVVSRPFGAAGSSALTAPATSVDPRAVPRGIPAGLRVFAVALPSAREVTRTTVLTAAGDPLLRCTRTGRCAPPTPNPEPTP